MNDPTPSQPAAGIRIRVVHLLVLSAFTTAQPIYDLLTRHPEFLPAHQSEPVDILLLTLMLSLLLPGAAALVVRGLSVFHLRLGAGTYLGLLGLLTAGLALQALKRLTVPAEAALVLSLLSGAGFVFVYGRLFRQVDLDSSFLLSRISGRVLGNQVSAIGRTLAIGVSGTVGAVTRTTRLDGETVFSALVPETGFRGGSNQARRHREPALSVRTEAFQELTDGEFMVT